MNKALFGIFSIFFLVNALVVPEAEATADLLGPALNLLKGFPQDAGKLGAVLKSVVELVKDILGLVEQLVTLVSDGSKNKGPNPQKCQDLVGKLVQGLKNIGKDLIGLITSTLDFVKELAQSLSKLDKLLGGENEVKLFGDNQPEKPSTGNQPEKPFGGWKPEKPSSGTKH